MMVKAKEAEKKAKVEKRAKEAEQRAKEAEQRAKEAAIAIVTEPEIVAKLTEESEETLPKREKVKQEVASPVKILKIIKKKDMGKEQGLENDMMREVAGESDQNHETRFAPQDFPELTRFAAQDYPELGKVDIKSEKQQPIRVLRAAGNQKQRREEKKHLDLLALEPVLSSSVFSAEELKLPRHVIKLSLT